MRVLLVDDEAPARLKLRRLLAAESDMEVIGEASHGALAVSRIRSLAPDLVFLDVQMPVLDGFGVIEQVGASAMPPVVFVTAFETHAVRAFEVSALDYLLKPVTPERFRATLDRVRLRIGGAQDGAAVEHLRCLLKESGREPLYLNRILVPNGERARLLPVEQITHVEADGNYLRLHSASGTHALRGTLTGLAGRLDPRQFLRIARGTVVRLDAIRELVPATHGDYRVLLLDGTVLTWSRRYRARDMEAFAPRAGREPA
jgi:two-component system, LytTR family, response regulator